MSKKQIALRFPDKTLKGANLNWHDVREDSFYVWLLFQIHYHDNIVYLQGIATDESIADKWLRTFEAENDMLDRKHQYFKEKREVNHMFGQIMMQTAFHEKRGT